MTSYRSNKARLSLETITSGLRNRLEERLPRTYPLDQYIDDLNAFDKSIGDVIQTGLGFLNQREFGLAGTSFTDASDLGDIYNALTKGDIRSAQRMIYVLDTAARDHIPSRLYVQLS